MNDAQENIIVSEEEQATLMTRRAWKWLVGMVLVLALLLGGLSQLSPSHDRQAYKEQFAKAKQAVTAQQRSAAQRKKAMASQVEQSKKTSSATLPKAPLPKDISPPRVKKAKAGAKKHIPQDKLVSLQEEVITQQRSIARLKEKNIRLQARHEAMQHAIKQQRALWDGVAALQAQLHTGKPFLRIVARLQALEGLPASVQEALARVRLYAKKGAVQQAQLVALFTKARDDYYAAYPLHGIGGAREEAGIWQWLGGLVQVQKVGEQHQGGDDAARLARAEASLRNHQLGRALREVRSISVKATPFFKTWRKASYDYLEARRAVRALQQLLFTLPSQALEKE